MPRTLGTGLVLVGILVAGLTLLHERPEIRDRALPARMANLSSDAPLRIVALGTSLTARFDWPAVLETNLRRCLERDIEIVTIAAPGQGSAWGLEALPRVAAAAPDLVVVEFAVNDADLHDGVSLRQSRTQHRALLETLQTILPSDGAILLMTMNPPVGALRYLQRIRLPAYYRLYQDLALDYDSGLADLYPRWLALPNRPALIPDGLHPTQAAARQIIAPVLSDMIVTGLGVECLG